MIPFEEAYDIAMSHAPAPGRETVALAESLDRVLAQEVVADVAMPPFDKAMVDGFACRRADLPGPMQMVETIGAGHEPTRKLNPGECAKIMTGAMLPDGADCVFMVEHSDEDADGVVLTRDETQDNIARASADVSVGDSVLSAGQRIDAPVIAILATMGCAEVTVAKRPTIGVIATGDELVEPDTTPAPAQIRNSNAYQLCAQVTRVGATPLYLGIGPDAEPELDALLAEASKSCDVLLLSGGVSMGDYDFVPGVLARHGLNILFDKVAIQPGKPTVFAHSDGLTAFGLPGNPVSTFVMFELLVRPYLLKMMGHAHRPIDIPMQLAATAKRKFGARKAWVPVRVTDDGRVARMEYHSSAHIHAMCNADGLMAFPKDVTTIEEGETVPVRILDR